MTFVSDFGQKNNYKEVLIDNDIDWEEERHTEDLIKCRCSHEKS
jgi:UDP-N-acetylmuramoylalanine--D-glutamate ligase